MKTAVLPPEIDTTLGNKDRAYSRQGHPHPPSSNGVSFREAETPTHCNKGTKDMNGSNPSFQSQSQSQSQSYPLYSQRQRTQEVMHGHGAQNGYYNQTSPEQPQSIMVSTGGSGYNNYYYPPPHHNDNTSRTGYPPSTYTGHQGQSAMQYNRNGNGNYPSSYNETNGRHPVPGYDGTYNQHQNSSQGMDFSRSVSSSFAESNKGQRMTPPSYHSDVLDQRDDISLGDSSWKNGLYQVASIEEGRFEIRQGATMPVNRICPTLSSDVSTAGKRETPTDANKRVLTPIQEPLDTGTSSHKDALEEQLELCSTGSSDLIFGKNLSSKRGRDSRQEASASHRRIPPINFDNLSMREQRDAPPTKRNRSNSANNNEDRELYSSFSMESMGSFGKEGSILPDFNNVSDRKNSHISKPVLRKEEPIDEESNERDLTAGNLSWEIKGQDSFGGGFSVSSNITDGITDEVLGKSFSFGHDEDFPCSTQRHHDSNTAVDLEKIDPISGLNPSESIDLSCGPETSTIESFPPNGATCVSNTNSQGRSFSMDSSGQHHSGPRYAAHPASNRFGLPPPYPDNRNGHVYRPPGPYGMGRPPHTYMPSSFQPPPVGMSGPPMSRSAPVPIYMMSTPHGGPEGMHGLKGSAKMGNSFSWNKADDARLQDVLKKHKNPKNWDAIAKDFGFGRTAKQCNERWIRYLKPGVRKGQWQDHEDAIVIEAVSICKEQPFTRWSDLAQKLPGRVGKQIRDRWVNHLNPNINHMPFAKEDDMKLWDGHKQLGKRWVEISTKYFNSSRSENHIKNRWYSASFKKFVASEFGPDAYVPCDKKNGKKVDKSKVMKT